MITTATVIRRPDGSTVTRFLSDAQLNGHACVACDLGGGITGIVHTVDGLPLFVHLDCLGDL